MVNDVRNVPFEAVLFNPVSEILWQQVLLLLIVGDEIVRHKPPLGYVSIYKYKTIITFQLDTELGRFLRQYFLDRHTRHLLLCTA